MTSMARAWTFAAIAVGVLALVGVSLQRARSAAHAPSAPTPASDLATPPVPPLVVVRDLRPGTSWGRLALVPVVALEGPRFLTDLRCVRAYVSGGRGLCLVVNGTASEALVFDDRFTVRHRLPLTGAPSRARVSADGRLGAVTVFEQGHSYAETGFSTRTTVIDLDAGTVVADLERFTFWNGRSRVQRADVNVWGVTFVPGGRRFYATLAYGGTPYLVEGDLDRREASVIASHVECPSLSPDQRTIAFKRAEGTRWRLWTIDVASRAEHIVDGETRSIDDQVEWLDDRQLIYQYPSDEGNAIWVAGIDGSQPARPFLRDAWTPAVVR